MLYTKKVVVMAYVKCWKGQREHVKTDLICILHVPVTV